VCVCNLALVIRHVKRMRHTVNLVQFGCRLRLKCDGTRAETRFHLSAKRTSQFKSAGASVQSTTGRRAVHISLQGLYCSCKPVFCSHVTHTGYPLHSLVSPSLLHPCVTVCHQISTGLYSIFPHYLINGTIFEKTFTENKMCFDFSYNFFFPETFLILWRI
jgi:hypothetical protein